MVENTDDGVKVRISRKSGEEILEGRTAIVADGLQSRVVHGLGLNQKRLALGSVKLAYVHYIMEGIETGLPDASWLTWTIPSVNPCGFPGVGAACVGIWADNLNTVGTLTVGELSPEAVLNSFINHPKYAAMFRHARLVKKEGMGLSMPLSRTCSDEEVDYLYSLFHGRGGIPGDADCQKH